MGLRIVGAVPHNRDMNKREYIKNITPGTAVVLDATNTVYTVVRVRTEGGKSLVTYTTPGDRAEWQVVKAPLTLVTLV
jgi:hypothetical protein